jgi:hypothetical protein
VDFGLVTTIITSAAVASIVSGFITLFGQALERRARRRELLLTRAVEMANTAGDLYRANLKTIAGRLGTLPVAKDDIFLVEQYFQLLTEVFNTGKLPQTVHDEWEADAQRKLGLK